MADITIDDSADMPTIDVYGRIEISMTCRELEEAIKKVISDYKCNFRINFDINSMLDSHILDTLARYNRRCKEEGIHLEITYSAEKKGYLDTFFTCGLDSVIRTVSRPT